MIKTVVQLDCVELFAVIRQHLGSRRPRRIKRAHPVLIVPARRSYSNCPKSLYHTAMSLRVPILLTAAFMIASLRAQTSGTEAAIENVLTVQVQAWNRGDISTFVTTYAEDCIFVGKQMLHGRSKLLARYRKTYPSPGPMGKLSFQNLAVRQLDGRWPLRLANGTSIASLLPAARLAASSAWSCNSAVEPGRLCWITRASASCDYGTT
jgi:uncharacterized protein (TIGR02246 family)